MLARDWIAEEFGLERESEREAVELRPARVISARRAAPARAVSLVLPSEGPMGRDRDGRKKERAVPEANTLSSHFRRVRRVGSDAAADGRRAAGGADSGGAKAGRGKAAAAEAPAPVASPKPVTPEKRKAQGDEDLTPASGAGCLRFTSPVYVSPSVKVTAATRSDPVRLQRRRAPCG